MANEILPINSPAIEGNEDTLSRVVTKALAQIEDILDIDIETVHPDDRMKMMSVKKDAASAIINAGLKADENRFRRENKDIVERLFDKIKKESKIVDGRVVHKV
jgi:hypothetical protein